MKTETRISGGSIAIDVQACPCCNTAQICRRRNFSDRIWNLLVLWKEVQNSNFDKVLCENCYNELREVLIDRVDDVAMILADSPPLVSRDAQM